MVGNTFPAGLIIGISSGKKETEKGEWYDCNKKNQRLKESG